MKYLLSLATSLFISLHAGASTTATYEVPGFTETNLAQYDISQFSTVIDGNHITIEYTLPLELTGTPNKIKADGLIEGQKAYLKSSISDLECNLDAGTCLAHYQYLAVDPELVKQRLQDIHMSPTDIQTRLEITKRFSGDPIGIIRFSLPNSISQLSVK